VSPATAAALALCRRWRVVPRNDFRSDKVHTLCVGCLSMDAPLEFDGCEPPMCTVCEGTRVVGVSRYAFHTLESADTAAPRRRRCACAGPIHCLFRCTPRCISDADCLLNGLVHVCQACRRYV
jgi:hypothetical protein